jgi:hypothetical protein
VAEGVDVDRHSFLPPFYRKTIPTNQKVRRKTKNYLIL